MAGRTDLFSGMHVRLTAGDQIEIKRMAKARSKISRSDAVVEKGVVEPEHYDEIIHLGVSGEYAAALAIGGHVIEAGNLIGAPADIETISGLSVEVKTRPKPGLDFILYGEDPEKFQADYGILVWRYSPTHYEVRAWMTRQDWLGHYEIRMLKRPTMLYREEWMESMWLFPDLPVGWVARPPR